MRGKTPESEFRESESERESVCVYGGGERWIGVQVIGYYGSHGMEFIQLDRR